MENEVLGYVKSKANGKVFPFVDKDENGYKLLINQRYLGTWYAWHGNSIFEEVDGPKETNSFIKNVHDLIDQQQEKGLKKYGTLVNKDDYSLLGWIDHAQQEAADLLIYLEVIKAKVKDVIG